MCSWEEVLLNSLLKNSYKAMFQNTTPTIGFEQMLVYFE